MNNIKENISLKEACLWVYKNIIPITDYLPSIEHYVLDERFYENIHYPYGYKIIEGNIVKYTQKEIQEIAKIKKKILTYLETENIKASGILKGEQSTDENEISKDFWTLLQNISWDNSYIQISDTKFYHHIKIPSISIKKLFFENAYARNYTQMIKQYAENQIPKDIVFYSDARKCIYQYFKKTPQDTSFSENNLISILKKIKDSSGNKRFKPAPKGNFKRKRYY